MIKLKIKRMCVAIGLALLIAMAVMTGILAITIPLWTAITHLGVAELLFAGLAGVVLALLSHITLKTHSFVSYEAKFAGLK